MKSNETTTATGTFSNKKSLRKFLTALNKAGISEHLGKLTKVCFRNGAFKVTLYIKKYAHSDLMKELDEGVLQKWGDQFNFKPAT